MQGEMTEIAMVAVIFPAFAKWATGVGRMEKKIIVSRENRDRKKSPCSDDLPEWREERGAYPAFPP